jgi:YbbR domain-containing protein
MKKLLANWGLKIASLLFAVIVWFLVTNINDPITSVRYTNVPVTIKNGNLITEKGQVYTVLDGSDTIEVVTVYAPRTVIDSLSQSNIVATADIQELSSLNTVSINVATNKYRDKIENITLSSDVVKLSVERKASKGLALSATTSGSLSDGYVIGDVTTEQNMVRVSGPESFINRIARASVDVDVTGFTSNIGTDADILLYDAEGNVLDPTSSGASMNIKTVRVNVQILETKYVPVNYVVTGEPASGYAMTGQVEATPSEVLIAGRSSAIASISEITVDAPELDVTGQTANVNATIELAGYLPSGVSFGDGDFNGTASVVIYIGNLIEGTFDVNIRNIGITNPVDGFDITVDDSEYETVSLTLQGLYSNIKSVDQSALKGNVDVSAMMEKNGITELEEGTYNAEVIWSLPDGVVEKGTVNVYVTVKKK